MSELERAKKLIRLLTERTTDRGFSEAEAFESASRVGELLQQFDLSLSDVLIRDTKCIQREVFAADRAMSGVLHGISRLCTLKFYVKNGSSPMTFVLFGTERDMELGIFLYEICVEAADEGWADWINSGKGHTRKQRESYRAGFGSRIHRRMDELRDLRDQEYQRSIEISGGTDLVLVRDAMVEEEFAKTGVRLVMKKRPAPSHAEAYRAGQKHGDTVSLDPRLSGQDASVAGLLA